MKRFSSSVSGVSDKCGTVKAPRTARRSRGFSIWDAQSWVRRRSGWGKAGIRSGTLVLDLKIGRGDYCGKEDRDTQHGGTYGVEGTQSVSWRKSVSVCLCVGEREGCLGKMEPVRWSEKDKIKCEERIFRSENRSWIVKQRREVLWLQKIHKRWKKKIKMTPGVQIKLLDST